MNGGRTWHRPGPGYGLDLIRRDANHLGREKYKTLDITIIIDRQFSRFKNLCFATKLSVGDSFADYWGFSRYNFRKASPELCVSSCCM